MHVFRVEYNGKHEELIRCGRIILVILA